MTETITAAAYLALPEHKRGKYGNAVVVTEEGRFDSTGEYGRWRELCRLRDAGAIRDLRRQVRYPLVVNGVKVATYVADFVYVEGGATVVEDWKGFRTPVYRMKRELMLACHGIEIRETSAKG